MKTNSPTKFLALLSVCVGSLIVPVNLRAQTEVFPLAPQLHYTYSYKSYYHAFSAIDGAVNSIDSGIVEYIVRDSSIVNDSTVVWNVTQKYRLVHTFHGFGRDSLRVTGDSGLVSVTEITRGLHQLLAAGLVWSFPLAYSVCQHSNQTVFRYAASDTIQMTTDSSCYINGMLHDTLWFSRAAGLSRRTDNWFTHPGNTTFGVSLSVVQLSPPVLAVETAPKIPTRVELHQNYPNPFNPRTVISWQLPVVSRVRLVVYDVLGREVAVLVNDRKEAGIHEVTFDGSELSSGVYFYRISIVPLARRDLVPTAGRDGHDRNTDGGQAGAYVQTRKLMLVR